MMISIRHDEEEKEEKMWDKTELSESWNKSSEEQCSTVKTRWMR